MPVVVLSALLLGLIIAHLLLEHCSKLRGAVVEQRAMQSLKDAMQRDELAPQEDLIAFPRAT